MAESINSMHTYSRKVDMMPSLIEFRSHDHSYGKKRQSQEPTGLTPESKRVDLGRKQQNRSSDHCHLKTKWSAEEKSFLFQRVNSTKAVHSLGFWKNCSELLKEKFGGARTGPMCRMLHKRQLQEGGKVQNKATNDVSVQTEPAIPVLDFAPKDESQVIKSTQVSREVSQSKDQLAALSTEQEDSLLEEKERSKLLTLLLNSSDVTTFAKGIFDCKSLKGKIWELFLGVINEDANSLKERRSSYLFHGDFENLTEFNWDGVIDEMCSQQRFLTMVLLAVLTTKSSSSDKMVAWVKPLSMVYGILMKNRIKECSRLQRVLSLLLAKEQVHQKIYDQLQPLGICLSHNVTSRVLNHIDGYFNTELVQTLKEGKKFRIIGDNENFMIDVSNVRKISCKKSTYGTLVCLSCNCAEC